MDAFTEKQMLETLKSIAASLNGIKEELSEINLAIFEASEDYDEDEDDEEDSDDSDDDDEEFVEIKD